MGQNGALQDRRQHASGADQELCSTVCMIRASYVLWYVRIYRDQAATHNLAAAAMMIPDLET